MIFLAPLYLKMRNGAGKFPPALYNQRPAAEANTGPPAI
jgi:hypothetical protein